MAGFSALSSAYNALSAHQRRTEVIAQNIANVDTPGYTRQRAELSALGVLGGASVIAGTRRMAGVEVGDVTRLADGLLEQQARQASSRATSLAEQARAARGIEQRLGGLGDGSLSAKLEALWNGFADVANDPGSLGARQVALQRADDVATTLNGLARGTVDQRRAEVAALEARVGEVNDLAQGIATLDQQIVAAKAAGSQPNELVDEQHRLLDRLAELVDVGVSERSDGTLSVYVDGHDLISEGKVKPLAVTTAPDPELGPLGFDRVRVAVDRPGGRELAITGGQVNGLLTVANDALPRHVRDLDQLASTIASTVNAIHATGAGLDGVSGRPLFDPEPVTAATIGVNPDLVGHPDRLAGLGDSADNPALHADRLVTAVGASVASLTGRASAADAAAARAQGNAGAVSGVNLDEELTQLMESQRAYEAAARLLTTIDEMLDVLINRTGLVGR